MMRFQLKWIVGEDTRDPGSRNWFELSERNIQSNEYVQIKEGDALDILLTLVHDNPSIELVYPEKSS